MRTGYPVRKIIMLKCQNAFAIRILLTTCYLVPQYIHCNDTTVQLLFRNDVNTYCIKYFFGNVILWHLLINIETKH